MRSDDEVNVLGDQDAENLSVSAVAPPASAYEPTAQNVRRYPELFTAEQHDQFGHVESHDDVDEDDVRDDDGNGSTRVFA